MELKLLQILFILCWTGLGKMEEHPEEMVEAFPQEISETEVSASRAKGIDVSHWQGKINWGLVAKSGVKHVFIKMSEGRSYADPKFVENWEAAEKAGLKVNCYHYFRAPGVSPKQQMENIKKNLKRVKFNPGKNALAIDVELEGNEKATSKEMANKLNSLLNLIKKDYPQLSVIIYTSYGYWDSKVNWKNYDFSTYGLWVAHWGVSTPRLPEPWKSKGKSWVWWQYSSKGKVDGISGPVDLNWVSV